jgi:hypothetical protein
MKLINGCIFCVNHSKYHAKALLTMIMLCCIILMLPRYAAAQEMQHFVRVMQFEQGPHGEIKRRLVKMHDDSIVSEPILRTLSPPVGKQDLFVSGSPETEKTASNVASSEFTLVANSEANVMVVEGNVVRLLAIGNVARIVESTEAVVAVHYPPQGRASINWVSAQRPEAAH